MDRLTDEQRDAAGRVWWIAAAAVRRAVRRNPSLRRYRCELLSFAGEYLVRVVGAYRSDRGAALNTYVTRRARYIVADWMRQHFGREGQTPGKLARRFVRLPAALAGTGTGADAGAVRAENGERVRRTLAKLNDRERRVVELVALRELTQREAARELQMSEPWVSDVYARAIARLGGETPHMRRTNKGESL